MEVTKDTLGVFLDQTTQRIIWNRTERSEFNMLSDDFEPANKRNNFYDGSEDYIKQIDKISTRNKIADLKDQLQEEREALPWE